PDVPSPCWQRLPDSAAHQALLEAAARRWDIPAQARVVAGEAGAVVVVNPNNPDGRIIAPERLLELAGRLAARGGILVVDEAFCDERPDLSLTALVRPGLVVLRSFGKFFGLAGLRWWPGAASRR
ncbi:aminotransferase class I/II-fold pyridoxal phosphate-dependent enzyme, partial [Magnetospirillum sp. 15-1]|uniref:aminotransferase class I/II-fold pyridoxal phosphate-dependent enzyme n=1 Tax=Magnetospirillum sp. 15-1 TaxID=1979370 RepID=UPI001F5BCA0C